MNMPNAHLFDMDAAISLARRLYLSETRLASHEVDEAAGGDLPYVRFETVPQEPAPEAGAPDTGAPDPTAGSETGPVSALPQRQAAASSHVLPAPLPDVRTVSFDSWEQCIMWCNQLTGSDASFVIDSQGFIIANYGRIPPEGLDGLGAELCYAAEMLGKISPGFGTIAWVDLDYDDARIVGYQVKNDAGESFILGFLSPNANYFSQKITISRAIQNNLGKMM